VRCANDLTSMTFSFNIADETRTISAMEQHTRFHTRLAESGPCLIDSTYPTPKTQNQPQDIDIHLLLITLHALPHA
jgi:hypothetical protein